MVDTQATTSKVSSSNGRSRRSAVTVSMPGGNRVVEGSELLELVAGDQAGRQAGSRKDTGSEVSRGGGGSARVQLAPEEKPIRGSNELVVGHAPASLGRERRIESVTQSGAPGDAASRPSRPGSYETDPEQPAGLPVRRQ